MVRVGTVVRALLLCGLAFTALAYAKTDKNKTIVMSPSGFAVSERLADLPIDFSMFPNREMPEPRPNPNKEAGPWMPEDPARQKETLPQVGATLGADFDGIAAQGFAPSDSNMAIGPNHIVETVNVRLAVYNKSGTLLSGPTNFTAFFAPLGGNCSAGASDPIVLYDRAADRWLISDIGIGGTFTECIAVSKTNDPTGAYFLYSYSFGSNLNDYPKLSTWATTSNSAYLATYDIFTNGQFFGGSDLCGIDRTKLLAGDNTAKQLCQMTPSTEFSYLPSDMDGPAPPADGTPGLFIHHHSGNPGTLFLRKLTLNFAAGTATLSSPTSISVSNYTNACHSSCVPQPSGGALLDALGDLQMYRFAVRHFADHDRAVLNHSVLNGSQVAVRWYELFDPAGSVTVNQQGTFAPDTTYRWMASIAEDQNADIALGFSASSSSVNPAVRFTGRVPSDPLGTMESEASIIEGAGIQNGGLNRWGDYSAMQVDPTDDCTFWFVEQYQAVTGSFNWHTRIGSFIFNGCGNQNPDFSLSASPNSLTIAEGNQGTSTITVTPINGFTGSVTLNATGLPNGVTAGFNPNPTTTTSTLTLTVAANAPTGTSTITITGVSGTLSHQTTLQLTVTASGPVVTLTPTSLTWTGKHLVGTKVCCKRVTVTNTGASTLNISNISITGAFALNPVAKQCGTTLAPGASCHEKVSFTPTQVGLNTGSLSFTDNAPGSPQSVPLQGTGK